MDYIVRYVMILVRATLAQWYLDGPIGLILDCRT